MKRSLLASSIALVLMAPAAFAQVVIQAGDTRSVIGPDSPGTGTDPNPWSLSTLTVGDGGLGSDVATLNILNGGVVSVSHATVPVLIGSLSATSATSGAGPNGAVVVDGTGSRLAVSGRDLYIGVLRRPAGYVVTNNTMSGTLSIRNGGAVTGTYINIAGVSTETAGGDNNQATGTVVVDGSGSSLTLSEVITVGEVNTGSGGILSHDNHADGTLIVQNGASVNSKSVSIGVLKQGNTNGSNNVAVGTVTVQGTGSVLTTTSGVNIGYGNNSAKPIGGGSSAEGTLNVTDGGQVFVGAGLIVGNDQTGTMNITDGGRVSSAVSTIGYLATGVGTTTVDGAGSSWISTTSLTVGRAGRGTLNITGGGVVDASGVTNRIGDLATGVGTVTVEGAGSIWRSGPLAVGFSGNGTLSIAGGGAVESAGAGVLADRAGSAGTATVDGVGSKWLSGAQTVGKAGQGTLSITNAGLVDSGSAARFVGDGATGVGTVTVEGVGSEWDGGNLTVGNSGQGTLDVLHGASVDFTGFTSVIGGNASGIGSVTVDDLSDFLGGALTVGGAGQGTLRLTNDSLMLTDPSRIGGSAGGVGIVTVGARAIWSNNGSLTVGDAGQGTLTIGDGGEVQAFLANVTLAAQTGSTGILNIGAAEGTAPVAPGLLDAISVVFGAGNGQLVFNHTDTSGAYVFAPDIGSTGSVPGAVDVYSGTTVMIGVAAYFGATTIHGGRLSAGAFNVFSPNSDYDVLSAGVLDLGGQDQTIASLANAGLVNFGSGTAPGTTLTTTDYVGNGGTFAMNVFLGNDGSPSDMLVIDGGTATGTTSLLFLNAGGPGGGTSANGIRVVDATNGATTAAGAFTQVGGELRNGALDYRLFQGGLAGSYPNDWFLRMTFTVPEPPIDPPIDPPDPPIDPPIDPPDPPIDPPVEPPEVLPPEMPPEELPPGEYPIIGPELATDGVVQPIARQLGMVSLGTRDQRGPAWGGAPCRTGDDTRRPEDEIATADCGDRDRPTSWGRVYGQRINHRYQAFADPRASGDMWGVQLGSDVWRRASDVVGLYVSYGKADLDIDGLVTNLAASDYVVQHTGKVKLDAWSGGAYWSHRGAGGGSLDGVVQWSRYGGASTTEFAQLDVDGTGFLASLEGGIAFRPDWGGSAFVIEPQVQVVWQKVSFDDANDGLGVIALGSTSGFAGRLGVKGRWTLVTDRRQVWEPYVHANLWADRGDTAVATYRGQQGATLVPLAYRTQYMEIGAGVRAALDTRWSLFAQGDYQFAVSDSGGGRRYGANVTAGLRMAW